MKGDESIDIVLLLIDVRGEINVLAEERVRSNVRWRYSALMKKMMVRIVIGSRVVSGAFSRLDISTVSVVISERISGGGRAVHMMKKRRRRRIVRGGERRNDAVTVLSSVGAETAISCWFHGGVVVIVVHH